MFAELFIFPEIDASDDLLLISLSKIILYNSATCTLYSNQAGVLTGSEI